MRMDKKDILKNKFGYLEFRYPQEEIIDSILKHQDTIGVLPTGFGKSVTFQIPALLLDGLTIVISPLIALMEDQVRNLAKREIPAAYWHADLSIVEQETLLYRLKKNQVKLLYVSPERLQNKFFINKILELTIAFIVVDEAHTILWAEGFREAFAHIADFIKRLPKRPPILALTATATDSTLKKIICSLELKNSQQFFLNMDRPNLFYRVYQPRDKLTFLIQYLKEHVEQKGIIYCLTRKKVVELKQQLLQKGIDCAYYHGGLDSEEKKKQQNLFVTGKVFLMVCTNAFGMGIDIPDIRFVMEYQVPASLEDLAQQLGRAARDGGTAEGVVLFSFADLAVSNYFIAQGSAQFRKENVRKLDFVVDYCLSKKCRHQVLASYFGFQISKCQNYCDNCQKNGKYFSFWNKLRNR